MNRIDTRLLLIALSGTCLGLGACASSPWAHQGGQAPTSYPTEPAPTIDPPRLDQHRARARRNHLG